MLRLKLDRDMHEATTYRLLRDCLAHLGRYDGYTCTRALQQLDFAGSHRATTDHEDRCIGKAHENREVVHCRSVIARQRGAVRRPTGSRAAAAAGRIRAIRGSPTTSASSADR